MLHELVNFILCTYTVHVVRNVDRFCPRRFLIVILGKFVFTGDRLRGIFQVNRLNYFKTKVYAINNRYKICSFAH